MTISYYIDPTTELFVRRAPPAPVNWGSNLRAWSRRPGPNPPQFDGTVGLGAGNTPGERIVQLRTRDGRLLEETRSDPTTGAFVMRGWYPDSWVFDLAVVGDDYRSEVFPATAADAVQWNGNPNVVPSTP